MQTIGSDFMKLDSSDYFKGFIMAIIGAILSFVQPLLVAHTLPSWQSVLYIAAIAGIGYLIKNFFTPATPVSAAV